MLMQYIRLQSYIVLSVVDRFTAAVKRCTIDLCFNLPVAVLTPMVYILGGIVNSIYL